MSSHPVKTADTPFKFWPAVSSWIHLWPSNVNGNLCPRGRPRSCSCTPQGGLVRGMAAQLQPTNGPFSVPSAVAHRKGGGGGSWSHLGLPSFQVAPREPISGPTPQDPQHQVPARSQSGHTVRAAVGRECQLAAAAYRGCRGRCRPHPRIHAESCTKAKPPGAGVGSG